MNVLYDTSHASQEAYESVFLNLKLGSWKDIHEYKFCRSLGKC